MKIIQLPPGAKSKKTRGNKIGFYRRVIIHALLLFNLLQLIYILFYLEINK